MSNRDKRSYYLLLPQDTPNACRYTPDYTKTLPSTTFKYGINPETVGVDIRKPVTLKKTCIDTKKECTLEMRIIERKRNAD